jgi:large subunit ribosomal protein L4
MTVNKQLSCDVRDSHGTATSNTSIPISFRVNDAAPKYLIHKAIVIQDRNRRQGTASCKTRSEVRGGGRKPWKQKGTGQARSGSSNSPLWNGGGVTFGPKPRLYSKKINIKERQLALSTAFYHSMHKVVVVEDSFNSSSTPKTKDFISTLDKIITRESNARSLVIVHENNNNLSLSIRNVPNVQLLYANTINLRDLLLAKHVLITEKALTHITQFNE